MRCLAAPPPQQKKKNLSLFLLEAGQDIQLSVLTANEEFGHLFPATEYFPSILPFSNDCGYSILDQVYLLKSIPLRLYANFLTFTGISFSTSLDWTNVSISSQTTYFSLIE